MAGLWPLGDKLPEVEWPASEKSVLLSRGPDRSGLEQRLGRSLRLTLLKTAGFFGLAPQGTPSGQRGHVEWARWRLNKVRTKIKETPLRPGAGIRTREPRQGSAAHAHLGSKRKSRGF